MNHLLHRSLFFILIPMIYIGCTSDKTEQQTEETQQKQAEQTTEIAQSKLESSTNFLDLFTTFKSFNNLQSCGFNYREDNQKISTELVEKHKLLRIDIEQNIQEKYSVNSDNISVMAIAKQKWRNGYLLLYRLEIAEESIYIDEYRLLVFEDGKVKENLFFCGSFANEGESNVCRAIIVSDDAFLLAFSESENVPPHLEEVYKPIIYPKTVKKEAFEESKLSYLTIENYIDIPYRFEKNDLVFYPLSEANKAMLPENIELHKRTMMAFLGEFDVSETVTAKLYLLDNFAVDRISPTSQHSTWTVLYTYANGELVDKLIVQQYLRNQSGYSSIIFENTIARSEMFELEVNEKRMPEVDHEDIFDILPDGTIVKGERGE